MDNPLGFAHFLGSADAVARLVLAVLLLASVGTWYLVLSQGLATWRSRRRSRDFLAAFWAARDLEAVAERVRETGSREPFSHLVHHGFTAVEQQARHRQNGGARLSLIDSGAADEMLTRALKRAIEEDRSRLEFGQTFLATVASSAPFVGLFGTVWGIHHALLAIGAGGQGTLDQIAGPVGEALIMTGIGLAVAIPAAITYNTFARISRNTLAELNSFAYDVFTFLATGIKSSPRLTDPRASSDLVIALARERGGDAGPAAHPGLCVR